MKRPGITLISSRKTSLIYLAILIVLGTNLLLIHLGSRPLGGSEGRWGDIAKEMIKTHHWIVPTINGIPYRDKPVASYWLIVLASLPVHHVTETTARLPSACAIVLSALFLYGIVRYFWERETAFFSSMIFLTTYPIVFWGRKANADTLTLLGTLICIWIFLRARPHGEKSMKWLYPFFVVAGITSLMKGLLGFVLPSTVVFPYLLSRHRSLLTQKRFWSHLLCAGTIGGALFFIPPFLDYLTTHTTSSFYLIFKENIVRFFHPFDHIAPFYYYFYYIFIILAPWSLFIPLMLVTLKKHGKTIPDEGQLFFSLWFSLLFVFFLLAGSKRGYYLLPVAPAFCALLARTLHLLNQRNLHSRWESLSILFPVLLLFLAGATTLLAPIFIPTVLPHFIPWELLRIYALPIAVIALASASTAWLWLHRRRILYGIGAWGAGIAVLYTLIFWYAAPSLARRQSLISFYQEVHRIVRESHASIAVYGLADRSTLYFYLDRSPIPHLTSVDSVRAYMIKNPHAFLIIRGRDTLATLGIAHAKILTTGKRKKGEIYLLIRLSRSF